MSRSIPKTHAPSGDAPRGRYARELVEFLDVHATSEERETLEELARRDREDGAPNDDE